MTLHEYPDLEQRSDEWYDQRRGIVTASAVGQLITAKTVKPASRGRRLRGARMKPPTAATIEDRLQHAIDHGDAATIMACADQLDAIDNARSTPELLASALWYASVGLHVFPLRPRQKIPLPGTHGCKDAVTDEDQIRAWWAATPDANIGIATGHLVDVIDIDGPIGVKSWAGLYDTLPPILGRVSTPRPGGNHLYVAATGRGNKAGIAPGVDHRGAGGYVVAPPSVNGEGVVYAWYTPLDVAQMQAAT